MAITSKYNSIILEGTAAELAADATIHPKNVILVASDTGVMKIGNGTAAYAALPSFSLTQGAAQADSAASTIAGLVVDFNALLAKLRTAGIIAT